MKPPQSQNKLTNIPSTSLHTQTNSQKKVVKTTKKKVTMPSPTVVSQASALPNALPVKYLTQFSVLLQVSKCYLANTYLANTYLANTYLANTYTLQTHTSQTHIYLANIPCKHIPCQYIPCKHIPCKYMPRKHIPCKRLVKVYFFASKLSLNKKKRWTVFAYMYLP